LQQQNHLEHTHNQSRSMTSG